MTKKVFETFRDIGDYEIMQLTQNEPSCFNGMVRVKKYRVTIEEVAEFDSVIISRINKLWRECNNSHHLSVLRDYSKKFGFELRIDEFGVDRKRNNP